MASHHREYRNERRRAINQRKCGCAHAWHQVPLVERITLFADLHDQLFDGSGIVRK